jgi:hypothetical protein
MEIKRSHRCRNAWHIDQAEATGISLAIPAFQENCIHSENYGEGEEMGRALGSPVAWNTDVHRRRPTDPCEWLESSRSSLSPLLSVYAAHSCEQHLAEQLATAHLCCLWKAVGGWACPREEIPGVVGSQHAPPGEDASEVSEP